MRGAARLLERCFWAIGFLALSLWLAVWFTAKWYQAEGNRELERRLEQSRSTIKTSSPIPPVRLAKGDLIGRIEIPRLDLSTVIFEGDDDNVLKMGVGHLAGSPLPGEAGNVVLAAHRDTFFRPLRFIRSRDRIDVVTPAGTRRYQVDSTNIVTPDHTSVLAPTRTATLTLVTCFPFDWFGHAPMRFIVRAHELNAPHSVADSTAPSPTSAPTPAETSHVMSAVDDASSGPRPHVLSAEVPSDEAAPSSRKVWRRQPDTQPRPRTIPVAAARLEAAPAANKNVAQIPDAKSTSDTKSTRKDVVARNVADSTVDSQSPARNTMATAAAPGAIKDTRKLRGDSDEATAGPSSDDAHNDPAVPPKPSGNRFLRGLKKLNPAPVWSKITGNS
jgi:sortase A